MFQGVYDVIREVDGYLWLEEDVSDDYRKLSLRVVLAGNAEHKSFERFFFSEQHEDYRRHSDNGETVCWITPAARENKPLAMWRLFKRIAEVTAYAYAHQESTQQAGLFWDDKEKGGQMSYSACCVSNSYTLPGCKDIRSAVNLDEAKAEALKMYGRQGCKEIWIIAEEQRGGDWGYNRRKFVSIMEAGDDRRWKDADEINLNGHASEP